MLTELSRAWQRRWLEEHGRRFCCYKKRADVGAVRPKASGTIVSVQRGRKRACEAILEQAATKKGKTASTRTIIDNLSVGQLQSAVANFQLGSNKPMENFKRLTKKKKANNSNVQQMRQRGCTAAVVYSTKAERTGDIIRAQPKKTSLSRVKFDRILNACSDALPALGTFAGVVQNCDSCSAAAIAKVLKSGASCVIVQDHFNFSAGELVDKGIDKVVLKVMSAVVCLGGTVVERSDLPGGRKAKLYLPAISHGQRRYIEVSQAFALKHRHMVHQLRDMCEFPQSLWTFSEQTEPDAAGKSRPFSWSTPSVRLNDLSDLIKFLAASVRVSSQGGVSSRLLGNES
jgi:hypothetical protein